MERYELPDGWEWSTLGECCDVNRRDPSLKKISDDTMVSFVPMAAVDAEQGAIANPVDRPFSEVRKGFTPFSNGDVIFAKITPSMENGKAAIASGLTNGFGFGSTEFHVMRPKESVIAEWVFCFIRQQSFRDEAKGSFTGTAGQLRVPEKFVLNADIPLAPVPEQQRVVAKIESLFEQSRVARTALTRVPVLMAQFRRAVLASAFRGELVEPDPNDESAASLLERIREARIQSGYKKSVEPLDTSDLPELPDGWAWATIEQIGDVSGGLTKNSKRSALSAKLPYLRVANVYFNRLELSDVQDIGIQESELARTLLKKGDLLVVEGNGSIEQIGRVAVWDGSIEPCVHQNHIIKVRFSPTDISRYILFWLLSTEGRDQIMKVTSSTSGLYTLSLSKVSQLSIPLAPLAMQSRIVAKIEAMFAQADIIEQAASVSLRRAEQVDQSILARAFRGELG